MNFDINTYQRVGPLRFGMTRQEVEKSIGHIDRVVKTVDGVMELYNFEFDIVAQISTNADQLIEVGFGHRAKQVSLGAIQFFEQPPKDVLVALYGIDPAAVTERLAKDGVSVAQVLAKDLSPAEYLEQSFANKIEAEDILHDWQDFSRAYLTASAGGLGADYLIISSWVPS